MNRRCIPCLAALLCSSAAALPQTHETFKTYRDAEAGVSFRYPSTWNLDPTLSFYGASDLLLKPEAERKTGDASAYDEAKAKLGRRFTIPRTGREAGGAAFVYAILPESDAAACRARAIASLAPGRNPIDSVRIAGVEYAHGSDREAGLGHQWRRETYTAFLRGRCFGFEEQIDAGHVDGWDEAAAVSQAARQLRSVMESVRIAPVPQR